MNTERIAAWQASQNQQPSQWHDEDTEDSKTDKAD